MNKTLHDLLAAILSEHLTHKTIEHEVAETRERLLEQIKLIDAEIEQLKNKPWWPKEDELVYMLAPGATPPFIATSFDPSVPFHVNNLILGHIFKTEDEAISGWNGRIIDQALRIHPKRVHIKDMQIGTALHVFGLIYDEDHGYVHVHSAHNRTAARRCLGGIVFSTEEAAEEAIAAFGQEALRDFAAYCTR